MKITEDLKHCRNNLKKAQTNLARDQKKLEESRPELDTVLAQLEKYRVTLADFERNKAAAEEELSQLMESLQGQTADLRAELEAEKFKLAEAEKSVSSFQSDKDLVENAIKLALSRAEGAAKNIAAVEEKLTAVEQEKSRDAEELEVIAQFEKSFEGRLLAVKKECAKLEKEEAGLQESIRDLVLTIETQKAALTSQQTGNSNKVVGALLQAAKNRGPLSKAGIRGRLGDLASIASEYDVAITTACRQLDFIVVETAEGAQQCVEFLRAMNLGRASFLILAQMGEWVAHMNRPISLPDGSTPRLFDLLTDLASEDLRPAFYFALRDTLVAADLDTAVRVAYEGDRAKWRVVTMAGQLIETSGAMSGGGNEVRKGGMRLVAQGKGRTAATTKTKSSEESCSVTEAEVKANEQKLREQQEALQGLRDQKKEKEQELRSLEADLRGRVAKKEKLQLSLKRLEDSQQELAKRLRSLERDRKLTAAEEQEIAAKQAQLEEIEREISKHSPHLKTIQNRVTILQREILSFGGMKLTKLQSKIDSVTQQVEMVSKSISTKEIEEANLSKSLEKLSAAIAKAEAETQKSQSKLEELQREKDEMEADVKKMTALIEASRQQVVNFEAVLVQKTEEFQQLKEKSNLLKSVELDLTMEQDKLVQERRELEQGMAVWRKEWEALKVVFSAEKRELNQTISNIFVQSNLPVDESIFSSSRQVDETRRPPARGKGKRRAKQSRRRDEVSDMPPLSTFFADRFLSGAQDEMEVDEAADSADEEDEEEPVEVDESRNPLAFEELPVFPAEELRLFKIDEIKRQIQLLEAERNKLKGGINMNALLEFFKKEANYKLKLRDLELVNEQRNLVRQEYDGYRKRRLEMFLQGFGQISLKLKEMYQMITLGGDAELELIDSLDPFSEGISFSVRPPKKSWKQISNLSGGEKTLSSLSLVFALHYYKPTPLYVMDEIDAALVTLAPSLTLTPLTLSSLLGLQKRVDRGQLHQGAYQGCAVHHHLAAQQHVRAGGPTDRHLQDIRHDQVRHHQPEEVPDRWRPSAATAARGEPASRQDPRSFFLEILRSPGGCHQSLCGKVIALASFLFLFRSCLRYYLLPPAFLCFAFFQPSSHTKSLPFPSTASSRSIARY